MNSRVDARAGGMRVASTTPGRIRLRACAPVGREHLASAADAVGTWPEARSVQLRPQSLSLIVHFDPERAAAVAGRLAELGVDPHAAAPAGPVDPALAIGSAVAAANRAVARRLDGTDLRFLVPLGLGLLAARSAMRGDERLTDAPWYLLAWYASETFLKFRGGAATTHHRLESKEE